MSRTKPEKARERARDKAREASTEEQEPQLPEEPQAAGNLFDRLAEDSYVLVHRKDDLTKQWVQQFRLSPEEATEEVLQDLRGGGEYRCQEKYRHPKDGHFVIGRTRTVRIDGPSKALTRYPASMAAGTSVVPTAPPPGAPADKAKVDINDIMSAGVLSLFNSMQGVQKAQIEAIQAMKEQRQEKPTDWAALLTSIATLAEKLGWGTSEKVNTLEVVKQVADLVKRETAPGNTLKEMLEMVNDVLDLKDRSAEYGDERAPRGDPLLEIARDNFPRLLAIIETEQKQRGRRPTQEELRRAVGRERQQPARQLPPAEELAKMEPWQRLIVTQKRFLLPWAQRGKSAEVAAMTAYEVMPDSVRGSVRELLSRPTAVEELLTAVPDFKPYETWVVEFLNALHDEFFPEEGDEGEDEPQEGEDGEQTGEGESDGGSENDEGREA